MQNVLLLQSPLLFYRVRLFNKLSRYLRERGYRLIVWPTQIDSPGESVEFPCLHLAMTVSNLRHVLHHQKIDIVVNYLCRRSVSFRFYLTVALLTRRAGRRLVYYGHGLNLSRRDSRAERLLSNLYLALCHGVILFSPGEKRYLWGRNQHKTAVAYNTLDLQETGSPVGHNRVEIAGRYGITEPRLVLFSARVQPRKRLEVLVDCFTARRDQLGEVGLVIVGPGMPQTLMEVIRGIPNIHYLGPVYEKQSMAELFRLADVFCIPGALGLAIVEAFYWGKPIVTLNVKHGPEAYYLRNGRNCVVVDDERRFADELLSLLRDENRLQTMGREARRTFEQEASLERMFEGFYEGLCFAAGTRTPGPPAARSREDTRQDGNATAPVSSFVRTGPSPRTGGAADPSPLPSPGFVSTLTTSGPSQAKELTARHSPGGLP